MKKQRIAGLLDVLKALQKEDCRLTVEGFESFAKQEKLRGVDILESAFWVLENDRGLKPLIFRARPLSFLAVDFLVAVLKDRSRADFRVQ